MYVYRLVYSYGYVCFRNTCCIVYCNSGNACGGLIDSRTYHKFLSRQWATYHIYIPRTVYICS